jgi:hypothetical protein
VERIIDASEGRGNWTCKINGARTKYQQRLINARLHERGGRVFVVTTRPVTRGEELILEYGDEYW